MEPVKTSIDEERLYSWAEKLGRLKPEYRTFIENFFISCGYLDLSANVINYVQDIKAQSRIDPAWEECESLLMHAFFDITYQNAYLN